jgi:26S proteasome regulatory subunit N7
METNRGIDAGLERIPDFELADHIYILRTGKLSSQHETSLDHLMANIKQEKLAPLYLYLHSEGLPTVIPWDESLYQQLVAENEKQIEILQNKIKEAESEEEELAIIEGWVKLGEYYARIGNREEAIKTLRKAYNLTASSGVKIDICFTIIRIGLFFDDKSFVGSELDAVKLLIDRGGDWERRNRYKTYNGLYLLSSRQFDEAAELLIDSLSTFTSTEIATYEQIVEYAVLCGAISLGRVDLKRKVIDSPEVLSLLPTNPALEPITILTNSLYTCEYATYFQALASVEDEFLTASRYMAPHKAYYVREMRRKAYGQLLESYKTLSMKSMADAFGVSVAFLDA